MAQLTVQWREQQEGARKLNAAIADNLTRLDFGSATTSNNRPNNKE